MSTLRTNKLESLDGVSKADLTDLAKIPSIETSVSERQVFVDSISDLLSLPLEDISEAQQVSVKEYTQGTGVGGGTFYWDSTSEETDNGGTIFSVSGVPTGRWKRVWHSPINPEWFGCVGDYDADLETPGQLAEFATDNWPYFNKLRLYVQNNLDKSSIKISGSNGKCDFWASNTIDLYADDVVVTTGTTLRNTVPSSFGGTVRGPGNLSGGGTIRNYCPDLDSLPLWQPDTTYAIGTYVRTSNNHVYYAQTEGTSSVGGEPTAIAGSSYDGDIRWRDALNENCVGVSSGGYVVGMDLAEASNKPISIQTPGHENCWIVRNTIGKSHHDGIEVKGNQGEIGPEIVQNIFVMGNIVKDAGRRGISIEQASTGTNRNKNIHVLDNIVISAGTRHSTKDHPGIRVNRCINPVFRGNKVLYSTGVGVQFRLCDNIVGDVHAENSGIWGLSLLENNGFRFSSVYLKDVGTDGHAAVRCQSNAGVSNYGDLTVEGSTHTNAYEELASLPTIYANSLNLSVGTDTKFSGDAPILPSAVITDGLSGFSKVEGGATLGATGRQVFLSTTGPTQVISGNIVGTASARLEIIIDGDLFTLQPNSANGVSSIAIPPLQSSSSLEIIANNNSSSAGQDFGWNVLYREL